MENKIEVQSIGLCQSKAIKFGTAFHKLKVEGVTMYRVWRPWNSKHEDLNSYDFSRRFYVIQQYQPRKEYNNFFSREEYEKRFSFVES